MSEFPVAFIHPAFEFIGLKMNYEVAIGICHLGLLPFMLGLAAITNRTISILGMVVLAFEASAYYKFLGLSISSHGGNGIVENELPIDYLLEAILISRPMFLMGIIAEHIVMRRSLRSRNLNSASGALDNWQLSSQKGWLPTITGR